MRHRLAPLTLLLLVPACDQPDQAVFENAEATQASFDAQLQRHLEAVQGRDLETLAATLADEVTVIFPNGDRVEGKQAVLEFHRDWFADQQWVWEPEVVERRSGNGIATALVRYAYRDTPDSEPRYRWLALQFEDSGAGWLLYHDQNTPIG